MKLVTAAQMRTIEAQAAEEGIALATLMEKAGQAVAEEITRLLDPVAGASVLVLVGPGNNGGDGLVAARHLHDRGTAVTAYCLSQRPADDANYRLVRGSGIPCHLAAEDREQTLLRTLLERATLVLDALLGTGPQRAIEGPLAAILGVLRKMRSLRRELRLVAVDLPTGLAADTGQVDPACVAVDLTLTLGFPKVGLYTFPGAGVTGEVRCLGIGLPSAAGAEVSTELLTAAVARALLPPRPRDANKGTFGRALILGGSLSYVGAPTLAALGAGRVGAGLVTLATAASLHPLVAAKVTEATFLPLPEAEPGVLGPEAVAPLLEALAQYEALLLGPGLGQHPATASFLESLISKLPSYPHLRAALDADGLNLLAQKEGWWQQWTSDGVLTPHPGEMARLLGCSIAEVQENRLGRAREAAARWRKTVVLKGAHTVVAEPGGQARVSATATPALATAGTGDVLAGAIAGLLAQGLSPFAAASLGVYLHAAAGELVAQEVGEAGALAGDLLPRLPRAIRELRNTP